MNDPITISIQWFPGESLSDLLSRVRCVAAEIALDASGSHAEAARRLGITRNGLLKIRKRCGMHVQAPSIPIPDDWRDRLPGRRHRSEEDE